MPRIRSHTRLIDAISHVSEDDKSDIVVVGLLTGGDGSNIEGMSDDESEGQTPEKVVRPMETIHRELKEPSNPKSGRIQRKRRKKEQSIWKSTQIICMAAPIPSKEGDAKAKHCFVEQFQIWMGNVRGIFSEVFLAIYLIY